MDKKVHKQTIGGTMKKMTLINRVAAAFVMTLAFTAINAQAAGSQQPPAKEVTVGINDAYIPGGFDSEADAYVVVNGIFQNGCYHWNGAEVKNVDTYHHEITSKALVSQGLCLMVLIPFQKEVRLGHLASGDHKLKFVNGDGTYLEKTMKVE